MKSLEDIESDYKRDMRKIDRQEVFGLLLGWIGLMTMVGSIMAASKRF